MSLGNKIKKRIRANTASRYKALGWQKIWELCRWIKLQNSSQKGKVPGCITRGPKPKQYERIQALCHEEAAVSSGAAFAREDRLSHCILLPPHTPIPVPCRKLIQLKNNPTREVHVFYFSAGLFPVPVHEAAPERAGNGVWGRTAGDGTAAGAMPKEPQAVQ